VDISTLLALEAVSGHFTSGDISSQFLLPKTSIWYQNSNSHFSGIGQHLAGKLRSSIPLNLSAFSPAFVEKLSTQEWEKNAVLSFDLTNGLSFKATRLHESQFCWVATHALAACLHVTAKC
jgi:hypothetical protein